MNALTGTVTLARLALRRDRVQLTVWVLAVAGLVTGMAAAITGFFETEQQLIGAVRIYVDNPAMRMFGLASGASEGAFLMVRAFVILGVLAALMSTLAVGRHTRQNEDTGRAEMIGAAVVGRHASLVAALIVTVGANIVLAILSALGMMANGLPSEGSIIAGVALGAVGIAFAGVAAVTAQVASTTRGANGLAGATLGIAFMLSAVGNMLGTARPSGLEIESAWPAWLSPLGWAQQMRPFDANNWWILVLFVAFFAAMVAGSFVLATKRDVGKGILPDRPGPATASPGLLSPLGLAWRLQRGVLLGWAIGIVALGAVYGVVAGDIEDFLSEMGAAEMVARMGGTDQMVDAYFAVVLGVMATIIAVYAVQGLLRMRAEETEGPLESVLATAVSKPRWMLSHIICVASGAVGLLLLGGLSMGLTAGLVLGDLTTQLRTLTEAALVQAVAPLVLAGLVIAVFGVLLRWATALSWVVLVVALVTGPMIGELLDLPQAVRNVSPFTHLPDVPAADVTAAPIVALLAIAVLLAGAGIAVFRRRELSL